MSQHRSPLSRVLARFRSPADGLLAVRIMVWAFVLPFLKQVMPIRPLVKLVWRARGAPTDVDCEERVVTFARWACRLTRWRSGGNCLERSLIAFRFLLEAGAAPTLVIGVGRAMQSQIVGHAWIELHGIPAGESPASVREYVPALVFGPDGTLIRSTGADVPDRSLGVRWA